ncbi:MAG: hypothetical protein NC453_26365 [Muribaculum sp.]|nr:hypothetical protein [Muribaculum sp.]
MKQYLFALMTLCLSINVFGYDKTENLLVNGDFSNGLEGWEKVVSSTPQYTKIWVEDGNCYFTAGSSNASSYYKCQIYQILMLQPGKYKCSFNFTGSLSYWGGSKVFFILSSDDNSFDTSWGTDDEILLREAKKHDEEFNSEYFFTLNKAAYIMLSLSVDACYANTVISNCKITRESVFLEPEAISCEREYGEENPNFKVVFNGLIAGDEVLANQSIQSTFICDANKFSDIGLYPIKLNCSGTLDGYEIKKIKNGELKVNRAPISVSCDDMERMYGDPNPEPTIRYSGFKNGENMNVLTQTASYIINATPISNVGKYSIKLFGASSNNYSFEYQDAYLNIIKAPLTGAVNNEEKIYGEYNPEFSITFYGLKNGESTPVWEVQPKFITDADKFSSVGAYPVLVAECNATNYSVNKIEGGVLNIIPRNLTLTANDVDRLYFENNPHFEFNAKGFVNGDNVSSLEKQPILETDATKISNVGSYEIEIYGAESLNYNILYVNGTLQITKRTATITADNLSRPYKENNPTLTYNISGLVNNESDDVLIVAPTIETSADLMSDCGNYPIAVSNADANNYNFNYVSGILSITKIDQTIIWDQKFTDITVGDQVELLAYTNSGLEVTYIIEGNVMEYKSGGRTFLDCLGVGNVSIRATQEGDKNYNAAVRVVKSFTITDQASVGVINNDDSTARIYSRNGVLYCSSLDESLIDIVGSNGRLVYHGKPQDVYVGYGLFIVRTHNRVYKILSAL